DEEIGDVHRDVAAALQGCLDRVMLHLGRGCAERTGQRRRAPAGGVALNCTANGRLLCSGSFDEIYIQPAAGDDGAALGAALYRAAAGGDARNVPFPVPFLGPGYGSADIDAALAVFADRVDVVRFATLAETCERAARLIADGRVVAWYRGRMEFGPRALGHRSIFADPGHPGMRDRINAMVKMREAFRPFAPAVSVEEAPRWFEVAPGTELPFMIMTVDVRPEHRAALPAITHVNGSARLQTVSARDNGEFHALLRAVGRTTGRELVLNTRASKSSAVSASARVIRLVVTTSIPTPTTTLPLLSGHRRHGAARHRPLQGVRVGGSAQPRSAATIATIVITIPSATLAADAATRPSSAPQQERTAVPAVHD